MNKYSVLAIALSFLLVVIMVNTLLISCSDDDDDDATPTPTPTLTPVSEPDIIPGEKLHELFINDPFSTCRDLYGEPEFRGFDNSATGYYFLLMYFNEELLLSVLDVDDDRELDDSDTIAEIMVTYIGNWGGTTAGGNGLGSSLESVKDEFGECESWDYDVLCCYGSLGIFWWFTENTTQCDQISISQPE